MTVLCWKLDLLYSHSKQKNRKMMVQAVKFCAMSVVTTPDKQKNDRVQGKQAEENQLHEAEQESFLKQHQRSLPNEMQDLSPAGGCGGQRQPA